MSGSVAQAGAVCASCGRMTYNHARKSRGDTYVVVCADCGPWLKAKTNDLSCRVCGRNVTQSAMTQDGPICDGCLRAAAV